MSLQELVPSMKEELKQNYLSHHGGKDHSVSYGELADADELVSDEDLEAEYGGIDFHCDDFFCTAGQYDKYPD